MMNIHVLYVLLLEEKTSSTKFLSVCTMLSLEDLQLFSNSNQQIRIQWVKIFKTHLVTRRDLLVDTAIHFTPGLNLTVF